MLKRLAFGSVGLVFLATPIFASADSTCSTLSRTLARGSRGNDVVQLQQFLIAQGFLQSGLATSYFGALTEASVRSWQSKNSLDSIGIVGPKTRAAIVHQCGNPKENNITMTVPGSVTLSSGQTAIWSRPGYRNDNLPFFTLTNIDLTQSTPSDAHISIIGDYCDTLDIPPVSTSTPASVSGLVPCDRANATLLLNIPQGIGAQIFTLTSLSVDKATIAVSDAVLFSAKPISGAAPLTVFFDGTVLPGYAIDWGDGTPVRHPECGGDCTGGRFKLTFYSTYHTYNTSGIYTAKVMVGNTTYGTTTITVR